MSNMKRIKAAGLIIGLAIIVMTFTVQPVAAATRYDSLTAFINDSYDNVEGGYAYYEQATSRSDSSFAAAAILSEWDVLQRKPPVINITKLKQLTYKLQWRSGGEDSDRYGGFSGYIAGPVNQKNTYDIMSLLVMLSDTAYDDIIGIDDPDIQANYTSVLVWLNKTQTENGGFGSEPGSPADMVSTYYALSSMSYALDALDDTEETWDKWLMNKTATIEWILNSKDGDAFKLSPISHVTSVTATATAILSLNILSETAQVGDLQPIVNWVLDKQTVEDSDFIGGFEESLLTNDTNLVTTFWAISLLDSINALGGVNASAAARFILDCQAENGGFANVPDISTGNMYHAYEAVITLSRLGAEYGNMINELDPNNPVPPLIDWRLLLAVGIIAIAAIAALVAMRLD
ncbi:MAG: hypothetical protein EAX95_03780 [Candidatus Thorarchaeota archaeon]|nr:hypothetical protein [Candidatus Thorarchaeota archaeon]